MKIKLLYCCNFSFQKDLKPQRIIFLEAKKIINYESTKGVQPLKETLDTKKFTPNPKEIGSEDIKSPKGRSTLLWRAQMMLHRYQYDHTYRSLLTSLDDSIQQLKRAELHVPEPKNDASKPDAILDPVKVAQELQDIIKSVRDIYIDEKGKLVPPPMRIPLDPEIPAGRNQLRHAVDNYIKKNSLTAAQKEDKEYFENRNKLQKILSLSFYAETGQLYKMTKAERERKWGSEIFEMDEDDPNKLIIYNTPGENKKLSKEQLERNNRIIGKALKAIFDELKNMDTKTSHDNADSTESDVNTASQDEAQDQDEGLAPDPIAHRLQLEDHHEITEGSAVKGPDEMLMGLESLYDYLGEDVTITPAGKWVNSDGEETEQEAYTIEIKNCIVNADPQSAQLSEIFDASLLVTFEDGHYIGKLIKDINSKDPQTSIPVGPNPNVREFIHNAVEKYYTAYIEQPLEDQIPVEEGEQPTEETPEN